MPQAQEDSHTYAHTPPMTIFSQLYLSFYLKSYLACKATQIGIQNIYIKSTLIHFKHP